MILTGSIVEQNVNGSHLLQGKVDDLLTVFHLCEIPGDEMALGTKLLDLLLGILRILLLIRQVDDGRVSPFSGKQDGGSSTNATVSSSDQCLLALELSSGLVRFSAAANVIREAKRPLLMLGADASRSECSDSLTNFVSGMRIPYFTTQMGKGSVSGSWFATPVQTTHASLDPCFVCSDGDRSR